MYKEAAPAERLYEQCSAASDFCARLTMAAQVYGGSLSLVVGAYLSSFIANLPFQYPPLTVLVLLLYCQCISMSFGTK